MLTNTAASALSRLEEQAAYEVLYAELRAQAVALWRAYLDLIRTDDATAKAIRPSVDTIRDATHSTRPGTMERLLAMELENRTMEKLLVIRVRVIKFTLVEE